MAYSLIQRFCGTLPVVACVVLSDCASGGVPGHAERLAELQEQTVTEEQIVASGAHTAWEALRLTVHHVMFYENSRGVPTRITRRGHSSLLLNDEPRIMLDAVPLREYTVLAQIPASDLESIEVLSAMDATTYYGTNYPNGLIRIRTKSGG
jgi:hypothetical protein